MLQPSELPSGKLEDAETTPTDAANSQQGMDNLLADSKALQQRVAARRAAKDTVPELSTEEQPQAGLHNRRIPCCHW